MSVATPLCLAVLLGCASCSGSVLVVNADSGPTGDARQPGDGGGDAVAPDAQADSPEPPPNICNGQPCAAAYCIHPGGTFNCSTCTPLNGPCNPPSFPSMNPLDCGPVPAPGDGGLWCVTPPPPPQPPYCSSTIPSNCINPMIQGPDVTCASLGCGG